ncbi:MAG: hypothetical protein JW797_16995 [Bradymonadales bacterium]|nr:hypothetical protein [Bradymonadales bacterium]
MNDHGEPEPNYPLLLERHLARLKLRTIASLVLYVAFVLVCALLLVQGRSLALEEGFTFIALGLFVASFLMLPRDYVPASLAREIDINEYEEPILRMRGYQRIGLMQRITYGLVALILLLLVPWLQARYGA